MDTRYFAVLFSVLVASSHVCSFSISSRTERSTDLADALAILQRQRRRVGSGAADFLNSERLLESQPLTLEDVSDWLSRTRTDEMLDQENLDPSWMSDGNFEDFQPKIEYGQQFQDIPSSSVAVEPSKEELEEIFDTGNDESEEKPSYDDVPQKKKKEEMVSVRGDKKVVQKKSVGSEMANAVAAASEASNQDEDLSLDTLTKEEFRALMKAVGKLQRQALKLNAEAEQVPVEKVKITETVEDIPKVVEPVTEDELNSVFESQDDPLEQETDILLVEEPTDSDPGEVVEEERISNITPEEEEEIAETELELGDAIASQLEDDIDEEAEEAAESELEGQIGADNLATIERYWLINNYFGQDAPQKRTAKRAVRLASSPMLQQQDISDEDNLGIGEMNLESLPPPLDQFVAKIIELQGEVDKLRMVSRLEDLENDVLTDALNEATLAQKKGSVSDMEFESLQQAIQIEEALQDLKNDDDIQIKSSDVIKRGEPWRRKKTQQFENENEIPLQDELPAYPVATSSGSDSSFTKDDIERLLGQSYMLQQEQESGEEPEVASLFMDNAGQCPAVQEYSTNCELADLYSLPVDYEARSLCNLHELCYACGNSLQVSQEHCDFVYRAAATALCQKKENCVLESEIFLRTMKLKTRYIPRPQPHCRSTCAAQFLGML